VNSASLSLFCFRVFRVSRMPGIRFVVFALSNSYFSKFVRIVCFSFVYCFWFLPWFFMEISTFLSISNMLSFSENSERGKPCVVRYCMVSALAVL